MGGLQRNPLKGLPVPGVGMSLSNSHFSNLTYRWFSQSLSRAWCICSEYWVGLSENYNVIKINYNKPVQHIFKHIINKMLEGCGGIAESEEHNQVFKLPIAGLKHGFPLILPIYGLDLILKKSLKIFYVWSKELGIFCPVSGLGTSLKSQTSAQAVRCGKRHLS